MTDIVVHLDDAKPDEIEELKRVLRGNPQVVAVNSVITGRNGDHYRVTRIEIRQVIPVR